MKIHPIKKVLIANRGEIAVRIIRACRELGIRTVAVYSDVDHAMPHVHFADEAYTIGPPPSRESYLVMDKIIDVAKRSGADAVHPGYGFLSERAEFAERVAAAGLIFVGPPADSIRAMGDKTEARSLMSRAGVPTIPGTVGAVGDEQEVKEFAGKIGFPVLVKAAAGGGGKGMRIARTMEELPSSLRSAQSEAQSAFGDGRVYVEKYLESPRHVEIQVLADKHGNIIHLGERECSIQRRHQKLIEEAPSVIIDEAMRTRMGETAVKAARACGYRNAGTIEFLVDKHRQFYFLEMNTRLQVEHPITEMRTGIDIVAAQLRVAMGEPLPWKQDDIEFRGHAIECRICAEDPANDFLPSTGIISHLRAPSGIGVREDRGLEESSEVSVFYDPLIAKLVVWGRTREEAISRMRRALQEYQILGVKTNIPLHLFVLDHPQFNSGDFDTHFLQHNFTPEALPKPSDAEQLAVSIACAFIHHNAKGSSVDIRQQSPQPRKWTQQRIDAMRPQ